MQKLDDIKGIEKIDALKMRDVMAELPEHCKEAYELGKRFSLPANFGKFKNIIFCGLGGSAMGAEVVGSYLRNEIKLPVIVNKDYTIFEFVNNESLAILISYSGSTEETLSAYKGAKSKGAKIIVLTSGGELAELAKKDGYPCLLIPAGLPPRGALAFVSIPVLAIFSRMGLIEDKEKDVEETVSLLREMRMNSLGVSVSAESNPAKKLAGKLFDKLGFVYGSSEFLSAVVTRWKGQFAENSKALASSHVLPEMNHNEIVGWQHPEELLKRFIAIILRDKQDHPQVKKRIEISKEIFRKQGVEVEEVYSQGEGLLARIFSLIYTGDFASLYLAILNGEDPTPVKRIDYLKKRLKEL